MSTGFFGIPGRPERNSHHVHIVDGGKPVCGTRPDPRAQYQWCSPDIMPSYVDCDRCRAWLKKPRS